MYEVYNEFFLDLYYYLLILIIVLLQVGLYLPACH